MASGKVRGGGRALQPPRLVSSRTEEAGGGGLKKKKKKMDAGYKGETGRQFEIVEMETG